MRMALTTALSIATALAVLPWQDAFAQVETPKLRLNDRIDREISAGETHRYHIDLRQGQFLLATVEQPDIDLVVRVCDPAGNVLQQFDDTGRGPEYVMFLPQESGEYTMEVVPFREDPEPGPYSIVVERLEPAAQTESGRVDQLFAPWDRDDRPGAAIAVVQDGEVIHKQGYGIAQLEYAIPITPSTVFPIESESKQFTAYAVAMLAQQGKLSLDDDIRMYLPDLPDFGEAITIRNLIHHTSGLREQYTLLGLAGWRIEDMITNDQIFRLVKRQRELNFSPGEEHLYCNTGYTLLAEIVSAVTGQPFSEWTADNIFRPLDMTNTHFHDEPSLVVPNRAYAYIGWGEGRFPKAVRNGASVGATGLFTTVEDLAKWVRNLDDARLGGPALRELIHTPGVLNNGDTLTYAFGLELTEYKGLRTVGHGGGGDFSFNSYVVRVPDLKFAVIILSNLGNFRPGSMAPLVGEIYLSDKMLLEEPEDEKPEEEQPETVPRPERADINPAVYDDYAGEYEFRPGIVVTVFRDGDSLWAWVPGQGRLELIPVSETRFFVPAQDAHITFQRNQQGKVTHYTVGPGVEGIQAMRIEPWAPEAQLAEYAGEYANDELEASYTIAVRDGVLSATLTWHDPITLTPTPTRDTFFGDSRFFRLAKFERDSENEITGFSLSGGGVRGVVFVRQL